MNSHKKRPHIVMLVLLATSLHAELPLNTTQVPRYTIIFVIDQFAQSYIRHIKPYCTSGFKRLFDHGICFTQAYHPHGMPSTATGHAALSTGTYAKDHGIIGNRWFDSQGNKIFSDQDPHVDKTAIFDPSGGILPLGKSSSLMMVDNLSDQFALASQPLSPRYAYSVSLKSRAAILTGGKLAKAFWFNAQQGKFTTSKAYYDQFPDWLHTFNQSLQSNINSIIESEPWRLRFPNNHPAYQPVRLNTYKFVELQQSMIGKTISEVWKKYQQTDIKDPLYEVFSRTPEANRAVLQLAYHCLKMHAHKKRDHVLLWVCLSSTDKAGHVFGPNSYELYDMLYHLDLQIGSFMRRVESIVGRENVLFALSADHGIIPIPEVLGEHGFPLAQRFDPEALIPSMNKEIEDKFAISELIVGHKTPQYYLNTDLFNSLDLTVQQQVLTYIKQYLQAIPAVKQVWTTQELEQQSFAPTQLENYFKQQIFHGRSGQIVIQTHPYTIDSKNVMGTDHRSPYAYDTNVPLIIYWPDKHEGKEIATRVWTLQLANTLARILRIQNPSASTFNVLPGIFDDPGTAPVE